MHKNNKLPLEHYTVLFKGSVSRDFRLLFFSWFEPIWATDKQPLSIFEFSFDLAEIFDHKVISALCSTPLRSTNFLINQHFMLIFSFMIYLFSPKRISPDCLFKATIDKWRIRFCFRDVQFTVSMQLCCTPLKYIDPRNLYIK